MVLVMAGRRYALPPVHTWVDVGLVFECSGCGQTYWADSGLGLVRLFWPCRKCGAEWSMFLACMRQQLPCDIAVGEEERLLMTKVFCNECGVELTDENPNALPRRGKSGDYVVNVFVWSNGAASKRTHLCKDCMNKILRGVKFYDTEDKDGED